MADVTVPWSLFIAIMSLCFAASCAVASWLAVSRSTRLTNALRERLQTPTSESRFATMEAEQAAFASSLQKLSSTVKRLSSRYGMAELRERRSEEEPPPVGAPKAQIRLWAARKIGAPIGQGPESARAQLRFERMSEDPDNG